MFRASAVLAFGSESDKVLVLISDQLVADARTVTGTWMKSHALPLAFSLHRINKKGSQKDEEQKKNGNYFFYDEGGDDDDDEVDDFDL